MGARLGIVTTNRGFWVKNGSNLGRLDAPGYIMGRDVTFSNVLPLIMEKDRLRDTKSTNLKMRKNHPSAARLYIGTGFAHMRS